MLLTIHHAPCTGGSIISQILAAATNSILVSEISPFAKISGDRSNPIHFNPTSLLWLLEYNSRDLSEKNKLKYFISQLDISIEHSKELNKNLLLRDHTHTTFNWYNDELFLMNKRLGSSLLECIKYFYHKEEKKIDFPLIKPIISVRHPLDSFIAARYKGWLSGMCREGINIDNYCERLLNFQNYMKINESAIVIRYEDLCLGINESLKKLFLNLNINYEIPSLEQINVINVTGKSGRKSINIEPRERIIELVNNELISDLESSKNYKKYCILNEYNPNYLSPPTS